MAESVSATEAANHWLNSIEPEKAREERAPVERFIGWFGEDRPMSELAGSDVARYVKEAGPEDQSEARLEPLRSFLAYSSRLAFTASNLVPFLQLGHEAGGARGGDGADREVGGNAYFVTIEGLQTLERELEEAKAKRPDIADKLRAAMADKDFRENAPLDAARDEQAHLEARIRDIEERLRRAVIIDEQAKKGRANVGSTVVLLDLSTQKERTFHLVSPNEVDPSNGKISVQSPVGVAVTNRAPGEEVEVKAPSGVMRFRLLDVKG